MLDRLNIKNNKGFTLVEILIVIALIGLLFGIGVPGVMKISQRMKERSLKTKIDLIEQAGILWGQDNKTRLQSSKCDLDNDNIEETSCYKITINELISDDYLEADKNIEDSGKIIYEYINPKTNKNISDKVVYVYKKNNRVYAKFSNKYISIPIPSIIYNSGKITIEQSDEKYSNEFKTYIKKNNEKNYNELTTTDINVNKNDLVYIKSCNKENKDECSEEKLVYGLDIIVSDNKISGEWHTNDFSIDIKSTGKVMYSWDNKNYNNEYIESFNINSDQETILYVKNEEHSIEKEYIVKLDKNKPNITKLLAHYDNKSIATLNIDAEDALEIESYKITDDQNCINGEWNLVNHQTLNTNYKFDSQVDGFYYLCVKDKADNINISEIEIADCRVNDFRFNSIRTSNSNFIIDYSFNINSNSNNLSYVINLDNGRTIRNIINNKKVNSIYSGGLIENDTTYNSLSIYIKGNICYNLYH